MTFLFIVGFAVTIVVVCNVLASMYMVVFVAVMDLD